MKYEEIVGKFNNLHCFNFIYPYFEYVNNKQYIEIECLTHGIFKQQIRVHLRGFGCKRCSQKIKTLNMTKTLNDVIQALNLRHGYKFTYPKIKEEYINSKSDISIICPNHGLFIKSVGSHMLRGCKKCALEYTANLNRLSFQEIVEKLNVKHKFSYEYFKIEKIFSNKNKIGIICPQHGGFVQQINNHMNGSACPSCKKKGISKPEIEIHGFLTKEKYNFTKNDRSIIKPLELDIYIPSLKKAIEFNGTYWHYDRSNPNCKPKGYHVQKSKLCRKKGIRLLHVREDLWNRDKEKMKQIILKFLQ